MYVPLCTAVRFCGFTLRAILLFAFAGQLDAGVLEQGQEFDLAVAKQSISIGQSLLSCCRILLTVFAIVLAMCVRIVVSDVGGYQSLY